MMHEYRTGVAGEWRPANLQEVKQYLLALAIGASNSANLEEEFGRDRAPLDAKAEAYRDAAGVVERYQFNTGRVG